MANQVCFRITVSIGIQQAQSQGVGPNIMLLSSECVIYVFRLERERFERVSVSKVIGHQYIA